MTRRNQPSPSDSGVSVRDSEIIGATLSPSVRWSCIRCRKRNVHAVALPLTRTEMFVCRACKRPTVIGFSPKAAT